MGSDRTIETSLRVHLEGTAVEQHRICLEDLVLLGRHLQAAVDRVGRILIGQSTSLRKGKRPEDVRALCSLQVAGLRGGGSITLECHLPPQVKPTLFGNLGEQALTALVQGLDPLGGSEPDLPRGYDTGVLLTLREAGTLFDKGFDRITFDLDTSDGHVSAAYTPTTQARVVSRIQVPVVNRRTIEGRLLMGDFKETSYRCRLHPALGAAVMCTFEEAQADAVASALRKRVRVVGEATFDTPSDLAILAREQGVGPVTDLAKLAGRFWPEDETTDDLLRSLRAWRDEQPGGNQG